MRQLLHISDIHFGPNYQSDVGEGVQRLVERLRPDLVVISGDITRRAKRQQFEDARAFVDRLPVPWIAVPGNHDVPAYRALERVFAPYANYRRYFNDDLEPIFEDDELLVIGVNTAFNWTLKDGRFNSASLRRLALLLSSAPPDKARVVVAHHQLTPPPRYDTQRVAERSVEAIELMARNDVEMVLSGHQHQTYVATSEEYHPSGRPPILFVHSGSTTSSRGRGWERGRNSCNWIRIDAETLSLHHLLWSKEESEFLEWNRRLYPRRHCRPYALGSMDSGSMDSAPRTTTR